MRGSRRYLLWLGGAVGFLGFVIWSVDQRGDPQVVPVERWTEVSQPQVAPTPDPGLAETEELRRKVAQLEGRLSEEQRTTAEAVKSIERIQEERDQATRTLRVARVPIGAEKPLSFPSDTPPPHHPAAFRTISEKAASECGMNLSLVETDCSEYPCIAFMRTTGGALPPKYTMGGCPQWEKEFGDLTTVTAISGPDGGLGAIAWMPVPPNEGDRRIALFRSAERIRRRLESMSLAP